MFSSGPGALLVRLPASFKHDAWHASTSSVAACPRTRTPGCSQETWASKHQGKFPARQPDLRLRPPPASPSVLGLAGPLIRRGFGSRRPHPSGSAARKRERGGAGHGADRWSLMEGNKSTLLRWGGISFTGIGIPPVNDRQRALVHTQKSSIMLVFRPRSPWCHASSLQGPALSHRASSST